MAQEVGLLALPEEILAKVAFDTRCLGDKECYSNWARATTTCKRLRDVQLPTFIAGCNWESKVSLESHRLSAACTQYMCRVCYHCLTQMN